MNEELRMFQRQFIRGALAPGVDVAVLSIPRGNGKSWLAAHLLRRCLTPGDDLHVPGSEYLLCAASIEQARLCYRFIRTELEPTGEYSFIDSATRIGIMHKASNTRLRVLSSNGKTAMGIVNCPLLVADEPGSWETNGDSYRLKHSRQSAGEPLGAEHVGPLVEGQVGGYHDGAPLVALGEDLEGQLGRGAGQGDKTQFVYDQQVQVVRLSLQVQPLPLVPGFHQFVH